MHPRGAVTEGENREDITAGGRVQGRFVAVDWGGNLTGGGPHPPWLVRLKECFAFRL